MEIQNVKELRMTWGRREWILSSLLSRLPGVYWRPLQFRTPSRLVHEIGIVTQSCPALCDPMYCSSAGSSVHGDSPGKNTGVGCHFLLQGSNLGLLHWRQILYHLSHRGSPRPHHYLYKKFVCWKTSASYTAWKCIQGYIFYALYHHLFIYLYSIYPSIHPPIVCQKEIQRTLLDMDILLNEKQNVHKLSEIQKLIKGWFTKWKWGHCLILQWLVVSMGFSRYRGLVKSDSVQLLSHVWLFVTPWTAAHQASLSITNSWSLLKLMSIELVMPSIHLILCCSLLLLPSIFPSIRVFSNESALCIRCSKYWSFSFSISPSNEYSGLISHRIDWLDLLAVQGTLKSLLQHHSSKASVLWCSAYTQLLEKP